MDKVATGKGAIAVVALLFIAVMILEVFGSSFSRLVYDGAAFIGLQDLVESSEQAEAREEKQRIKKEVTRKHQNDLNRRKNSR